MAVVEVKVGTRNFQLACESGQEEHISGLAVEIDKKLEALSKQMRTNNEPLLLLMTALMMQDELNDAGVGEGAESSKKSKIDFDKIIAQKDSEMSETLNTVSDYIEGLLGKVEAKNKAA